MIVALHTGTSQCLLRVYDGTTWQVFDWEAGRLLAKDLLGHLDTALQTAGGTGIAALTGLVVFEGPGSYTGLRIGLTVANTLADSLSIPIVGMQGDDWLEAGLKRLNDGDNDRIVMPIYGGNPHITTARK